MVSPVPARPDSPLISVVVVNFNGRVFLKNCLPALFSQDYRPFEVIFVDNASSDGTVEYVRTQYPGMKISLQQQNLGFSGGANAGIRETNGDFILTLNPDTTMTPHFLEELIKPMSDPSVGMCSSKMILLNGRINSTGICISRSGAAWDRGMNECDDGRYDTREEVFGPSGGAALYRRAMFEEIGLFDEDFFLYMEDVDIAFRGRLAGWKCIYVPTARVFHVHCGTTGYRSSLSIYYGNRNLIWYIVKNFPLRTLLLCSPWIIGRNLADIPFYLLQGRGMAVIKAKINMMKGLVSMIKKRKMIKRIVPDAEIERWIHVWSQRIKD